tara:strand:- start:57216 stop:57665 length:450 start_codon:yes stop_codon:yes gene_type:complete
MAYNEESIQAANEELEKRINSDRKEWRDKITVLVKKIKNVSELSECQVQMLSYRQIILDKLAEFKTIIYKRNASLDRYYRSKYREYTINYDVKLTSGEKNSFIKAELSSLRTQINILQGHIDYYLECVKTLDNMAFAIRNRIRLNDDEI